MPRTLALAALVLALGMTAATLARPVTYALPAETSALKPTRDPGYFKADALCSTCHSRDYITTQPAGKGKEFWAAEVTKMVVVYGAPIPELDRPAIIEYLGSTY